MGTKKIKKRFYNIFIAIIILIVLTGCAETTVFREESGMLETGGLQWSDGTAGELSDDEVRRRREYRR